MALKERVPFVPVALKPVKMQQGPIPPPLHVDTYEKLRDVQTKKSDFLKALEVKSVSYSKKHKWKGFVPADELLLACALNADVIKVARDVFATVELKGEFTWGQMVVDWNCVLKKSPNLTLVTDIHSVKYVDILYKAVDRNPPEL